MRCRVLCGFFLLLFTSRGRADLLTFDSAEEWALWEKPFGLTQIGEKGQLQLVRFRKDINVVQDAHLFFHPTKSRGEVEPGGLWSVGSGRETAERVIDGDPETYWKPDPQAALEDWSIIIDLGRAVLAREIRLTFPDQEGARPFRQFTVLVSTGVRVITTEDIFNYRSVYRTTLPNTDASIVIPLSFATNDSVMKVDPALKVDPARRDQYRLIQYVNIMADEKNADAALAEIEVIGVGDNIGIGIGIGQRGGFTDGLNATSTYKMFDADLNTNNTISSGTEEQDWKEGGVWFAVDLGAVFFIDEMFIYALSQQEGTIGFGAAGIGSGHVILYSDEGQMLRTDLPVTDALDYTELLTHMNPGADGLRYLRYLFKPRKMRYLLLHGDTDAYWGLAKWGEFMLFSPGYPAQVVLSSDFIDLGQEAGDGRPKVIKALHWDADRPLGTRLQLRSRSGNSLEPVYTFYDKKGTEISESKWNSSPKVIRGPVDTTLVVGEDWDGWSNEYQESGMVFKSATPRRFVQLEMILSSDDPGAAPTVNSLAIEYEEALVQEAKGSILPRQVRANEETRFTYVLRTRLEAGDSGFDLLRFTLLQPVDLEKGVSVEVGGETVTPSGVEMHRDSLLIGLPRRITSDSLRVSFTTRVLKNATVFPVDLGFSGRPGLWQSAEAAERKGNIVFLPELPGSGRLIGDLEIVPPLFTPNGDGVNDAVEIRFAVFKIDAAEPQVQIFDLAGNRVAELEPSAARGLLSCTWTGVDLEGKVVLPGIYLCRIDLGAEAGTGTVVRVIGVAH